MINQETPSSGGSGGSANFKPRNTDFDYLAHVVGAALIIGAVIISGTMLYMFKAVGQRMDAMGSTWGSFGQTVAGQTAGSAPAPTIAAANPTPVPTAPSTPVKVTLKSNTPYLGSSNAKVTVVEFADYQCPYCEALFKTALPELSTQYVSTGKIKFVYQDFAFLGADSNTAGEGSHCAADQQKFWQFHDYLFNHQGQERSGWASAANLKQFAQDSSLGLNATQFGQCLDSGKYKQEVLDETAAGHSYGISGTPTILVLRTADPSLDVAYINSQVQQQKSIINLPNGNTMIVGAQPASVFEQAIDAALKK